MKNMRRPGYHDGSAAGKMILYIPEENQVDLLANRSLVKLSVAALVKDIIIYSLLVIIFLNSATSI